MANETEELQPPAPASAGSHQTATPVEDVQPFHFDRTDGVAQDSSRALASMQQDFALSLTRTLGAWLRTSVLVSVSASEASPTDPNLEDISEHDFVSGMTTGTSGLTSFLQLDSHTSFALVNRLLGGSGEIPSPRNLTQLDATVLRAAVDIIIRELNGAWSASRIAFVLDDTLIREKIRTASADIGPMLRQSFNVQIDDTTGRMLLYLPAAILAAMSRGMDERRELRHAESRSQAQMERLLGDAQMRAALRLPRSRIAADRLKNLTIGSVLELPLARYSAAEFLVAGERICQAVPVGQGDHRAALLNPVAARSQNPA